MIISDFTKEYKKEKVRTSAVISYENRKQIPKSIYFEIDKQYEDYLNLGMEPFLLAAAIPAMFAKEKQVFIDPQHPVSGSLINNLNLALRLIIRYFKLQDLFVPKFKIKTRYSYDLKENRAASFFSGGIDALFTLKYNHDNYPIGHPKRIRDTILVKGFDIDITKDDQFEMASNACKEVAKTADVNLITIFTNIKELAFPGISWSKHHHGAALAAVSFLLNRKLKYFFFGSDFSIDINRPTGSDALLMHLLGDDNTYNISSGLEFNRQEKIFYLMDWHDGLKNLRVCWQDTSHLNCGTCEKCIRTKLGLHAAGINVEKMPFNDKSINKNHIYNLNIKADKINGFQDILPFLSGDMENALRTKLHKARKKQISQDLIIKIRQKIKLIDRKLFNSSFTKLRRHIRLINIMNLC